MQWGLYYISALSRANAAGGMIELFHLMQYYHPVSKTQLLPQSPLLLSITLNIWIHFRRSGLVKQKLSVEVVLMCVMKWSKEMPPSHRAENNISVDNVSLRALCRGGVN